MQTRKWLFPSIWWFRLNLLTYISRWAFTPSREFIVICNSCNDFWMPAECYFATWVSLLKHFILACFWPSTTDFPNDGSSQVAEPPKMIIDEYLLNVHEEYDECVTSVAFCKMRNIAIYRYGKAISESSAAMIDYIHFWVDEYENKLPIMILKYVTPSI